ncbi:hypothetical protein CQA49_00885 [Helicobacter sp. MIT 00-7814]|uniref:hypothetical protein n=1 Tax=unclassified Helicobacter TaxID=2593540 RepID=UPI000E1E953E|nr:MULTISPECIES: hypothetical protein [unclassified Helicobacter]RDU55068.1 hypothetical protein CQA37_04475 [Helicobacter sp. MIT 99-10781]RDU56887.1 hypothetical protein CQA49_00885 [Helicobacter sp. MIT 00-7814]
MKILFALPFLFYCHAFAECQIHDDVLFGIATIEGHPKRDLGYPYIISFNKKSDIYKLTEDDRWFSIDSRTIDCLDTDRCLAVYSEIRDLGIKDIDLGAFQINPRFWQYNPEEYFDFEKSKQRACEILTKIKDRHGWSWESIAKYHSKKKENNLAYQKRLKAYWEKSQAEAKVKEAERLALKDKPLKRVVLKLTINEE